MKSTFLPQKKEIKNMEKLRYYWKLMQQFQKEQLGRMEYKDQIELTRFIRQIDRNE